MARKKGGKPDNPDIQKPRGKVGDEEDKARTRKQVETKIAEEAEALRLHLYLMRKAVSESGVGPGDIEEFLKQFVWGYKDVFQANGIQVPSDASQLWEALKTKPYGEDRDNAPRIIQLNKAYQVVPPDIIERNRQDNTNNGGQGRGNR